MEPSPEHSSKLFNDGADIPEGNPPIREHLHPVDPLPSILQDRLDKIMSGNA